MVVVNVVMMMIGVIARGNGRARDGRSRGGDGRAGRDARRGGDGFTFNEF